MVEKQSVAEHSPDVEYQTPRYIDVFVNVISWRGCSISGRNLDVKKQGRNAGQKEFRSRGVFAVDKNTRYYM